MNKLTRRIARLAQFQRLLVGRPADPRAVYLMREACMVVEQVARDYPQTKRLLRDRLPLLYTLAGKNQN